MPCCRIPLLGVLQAAEEVVQHIIETYAKPNLNAAQIQSVAVSSEDPLTDFSDICRTELESMQRQLSTGMQAPRTPGRSRARLIGETRESGCPGRVGALRPHGSGGGGFAGGALVPAAGNVLGSDYNPGDHAVIAGCGAGCFLAAFCGDGACKSRRFTVPAFCRRTSTATSTCTFCPALPTSSSA
jgi:hypothetical protein